MSKKSILISCEHGGNEVPEKFADLFKEASDVLLSHRGFDIGTLDVFNALNNENILFKQINPITRLLIDVNRSLYRRTLFSEFTRHLSKTVKQEILDDYYYAYRNMFENKVVEQWCNNNTVLHISLHSFASELHGKVRETDFGILYHPQREAEKSFARLLKGELKTVLPEKRVRYNYPYSGKPDGFVRHFRDLEVEKYLGIEFEMNQKFAKNTDVIDGIVKAFYNAFEKWKRE